MTARAEARTLHLQLVDTTLHLLALSCHHRSKGALAGVRLRHRRGRSHIFRTYLQLHYFLLQADNFAKFLFEGARMRLDQSLKIRGLVLSRDGRLPACLLWLLQLLVNRLQLLILLRVLGFEVGGFRVGCDPPLPLLAVQLG